MTPLLSHPKYRPDIDGLRGIAILSVVAYHAFPEWIKGGFIGVDIFFVISGFLISTIIFENLNNGTFSFAEFYARRIRRIFPALILVLITCFAFGWIALLADELNQLGKHVAAGAGFVSNFILWSEAGYFDNSSDTKPLLHLWSLGIEEQFYIIWPLFLWFIWKRKFNPFTITTLILIISFYLNVRNIKTDAVATFYSPQTRFWELLSGSLLAWFILYKKEAFTYNRNKIDSKIISNFISFFGLFLLVYGFWRINEKLNFPGQWALLPVISTILIISASSSAWVNRTILSNKVIVWFGLISFPLYLWHWPLLSFAKIIKYGAPKLNLRLELIAASILLSWLTVKVIEKPFRFQNEKVALKIAVLCSLASLIGISGFFINKADLSQSHTYKNLAVKRKGEHAIGSSLAWYRGKENWLFLGNSYNNTVAKLKLAVVPSKSEIKATKELFSDVAKSGSQFNSKVVLIIGPNKSNIYSEYLPDGLLPSPKKYSSFFLNELENIQNLTVYNPTSDFLRLKKLEGILYWKTDTHWNNKGAFIAYSGFSTLLGLPIPEVEFQQGANYSGDLIGISKLKNFPLENKDNWNVVWKNKPIWQEKEISGEPKTTFGSPAIVTNQNPLLNKYIWVVGDSFTGSLKQYFNTTFKEVHYLGHWKDKLKELPSMLDRADKKPDMVIIVRVERSF